MYSLLSHSSKQDIFISSPLLTSSALFIDYQGSFQSCFYFGDSYRMEQSLSGVHVPGDSHAYTSHQHNGFHMSSSSGSSAGETSCCTPSITISIMFWYYPPFHYPCVSGTPKTFHWGGWGAPKSKAVTEFQELCCCSIWATWKLYCILIYFGVLFYNECYKLSDMHRNTEKYLCKMQYPRLTYLFYLVRRRKGNQT